MSCRQRWLRQAFPTFGRVGTERDRVHVLGFKYDKYGIQTVFCFCDDTATMQATL